MEKLKQLEAEGKTKGSGPSAAVRRCMLVMVYVRCRAVW